MRVLSRWSCRCGLSFVVGCSGGAVPSEATGGTGGGGQPGRAGASGTDQSGAGGGAGGRRGVEASCDRNATPCGGDVVGTWKVTSSCLTVSGTMDLSRLGLRCTSARIASGHLEVSGTWTHHANATYADETVVTGTETLELPASCKELSSTPVSCRGLDAALAGGLGYESMSCGDNDATGGCTCTASVDQVGGLGVAPMVYPYPSGNYVTADGTIVVAADEQEYSYCVAGTMLTVTPKSVDKTGTVTGMIVLEKE